MEEGFGSSSTPSSEPCDSQGEEGVGEDGGGEHLLANTGSFLLSFSKAFSFSLMKPKWYYKSRDGLLG